MTCQQHGCRKNGSKALDGFCYSHASTWRTLFPKKRRTNGDRAWSVFFGLFAAAVCLAFVAAGAPVWTWPFIFAVVIATRVGITWFILFGLMATATGMSQFHAVAWF